MPFTFEIEPTPDWATLDGCADRTIFQTKLWLDFVSEAQSARPLVLRVLEGSSHLGYFTGLIVKRMGFKILGSPFPGWTTSYMGFNLPTEVARDQVCSGLFRFAFRDLGCSHVEMMDRNLSVETVQAAGWNHRIFHNFEIDLTPSEEEIFGQMKGSCRTSIRKSQREGVVIEIASDPEFADDYYSQMVEVFAKQGLRPSYSIERVRLLMKHLLPTGNLLLLRARTADGECAATGVYPAFNDTMYFWGGASLREFQILQPNEPLHWYAMLYWKQQGIRKCDMGGGGEYKRKYGGREIHIPWFRKSRYPGTGNFTSNCPVASDEETANSVLTGPIAPLAIWTYIVAAMKYPELKKITLQTIGCRLNQYETEKMAAELYPLGFRRTEPGEKADLFIINTCTVTHKADSDCRQAVRKAARENPDGRVVVAGCYVDNDPNLVASLEGVDVVIRNSEKERIATILPGRIPDLFDREPDTSCSTLISDFHGHNRAWLKVSDGCNQWCSFCIIPTVRGRLRNRPAADIIAEVRNLISNGYNEVVLTGVHLGHYKNHAAEPHMKNLAALCRAILEETSLPRLRLSSIEPQTVRDDLVDTYRNSQGRICRHMHIPLQSGSSRILRLMQRPYDQNTYIRRVTAVKEACANTIVGGDVIVGFPGETASDFEQTRRLAESGLIDYLHVFSYSDRPGTPASTMTPKVAPEVIKERNSILTSISEKLRANACRRQIGETLEVIAEHKRNVDASFWGVADNFIKVKLPGWVVGGKQIVRVKISSAADEYVEGTVVDQQTRAVS